MSTTEVSGNLESLLEESRRQVRRLIRMVRTILVVCGVTSGAALIGLSARPVHSQAQSGTTPKAGLPPLNVQVTNTGANPVPVTGSLSSSVSGTVSAQQSGTWNVGVTGTPGVLLANPTANPGQVRDLSTNLRKPFAQTAFLSFADGSANEVTQVGPIPNNSRFVIENVSADFNSDNPNSDHGFVTLWTGGNTVPHFIPVANVGNSYDTVADQTVKIYAEPGSQPNVMGSRANLSGRMKAFITFDGYLEQPL